MAKKASGSNSYVSMQNMTKSTNWQLLQKAIIQGFPDHRHQLPEECRRYWNTRHQLTIDDGLIVYSCCLVIPTKMRQEVLHQFHESHQELVRTKQRARLVVYWPDIDNDIDDIICTCQKCQDTLPSNSKEPIISNPKPERPFQEIDDNLCLCGGQDYSAHTSSR